MAVAVREATPHEGGGRRYCPFCGHGRRLMSPGGGTVGLAVLENHLLDHGRVRRCPFFAAVREFWEAYLYSQKKRNAS